VAGPRLFRPPESSSTPPQQQAASLHSARRLAGGGDLVSPSLGVSTMAFNLNGFQLQTSPLLDSQAGVEHLGRRAHRANLGFFE